MNAGKNDGFFPARLIETLNQNMEGRVEIGRIDLFPGYALFDVKKGESRRTVSALKNARYFGKRLYAEIAAQTATTPTAPSASRTARAAMPTATTASANSREKVKRANDKVL